MSPVVVVGGVGPMGFWDDEEGEDDGYMRSSTSMFEFFFFLFFGLRIVERESE